MGEDVEAVGVPLLVDQQRNLCVSDEVRKVCGDDEGGKSVLWLQPVCLLLLLHSFARQKQARHPGDNQTAPVWFLWQLALGLLPTLFAPEGCGGWRQPCRQCRCSGSSPLVCCPPSLPRKAVEGGGNPAVSVDGNVNVNVNSRTDLDIGGLNARTGNFPQEETTLWSEEFGPK